MRTNTARGTDGVSRSITFNDSLPTTYAEYKGRLGEIRKKKKHLSRRLAAIQEELQKRREKWEKKREEKRKKKRESKKHRSMYLIPLKLTLPAWENLKTSRFRYTVGAINIMRENPDFASEFKSRIDAAVTAYISHRETKTLLNTLQEVLERTLSTISGTVKERRERFRNSKEFQLIKMNNKRAVAWRFKIATQALRRVGPLDTVKDLQEALNQLANFRNLEKTFD